MNKTTEEEKCIGAKEHDDRVARGKAARKHGRDFEKLVRDTLESEGWLVCKNDNQVYFDEDCYKKAKPSYNPFRKSLQFGTGFPDFLCVRLTEQKLIEVKLHGKMSREEKDKVAWIKSHVKIPIFVAFENKDGDIEYKEL